MRFNARRPFPAMNHFLGAVMAKNTRLSRNRLVLIRECCFADELDDRSFTWLV